MTAKDDRFVEVAGDYIQTPESTEFSGLDPRKEREKLRAIIEERNGTYNDGLDIKWSFKLKGERKPIAVTAPGGKNIERWEILDLADTTYVVIEKSTHQQKKSQTDQIDRFVVEFTLEKYDAAKHTRVSERVQY